MTKKAAVIGRVYLFEALGSVIGGVLFTYVLIGFIPTFIIALAVSFISILACWYLLAGKIPRRNTWIIFAALAVLFVYFKIEPAINRTQWEKYDFITQKEARNATLSLVRMGSITNVFVDGILSASFPDEERYETVAHWPMLASAMPGRVLLAGDLSPGIIKEVLKHGPESIDYIMLDDSFLELAGPYLGTGDISALKDPRVNIHYGDSRLFVREKAGTYDVVIFNIPEVPNLKINRFYTEEFYGQIKKILKPDGVLALSVASSENYLSSQTRMFNASVYHTLKSAFNAIEMIPGDTIMFLCSPSSMDVRAETMEKRFNNRRISNRHIIPSYIAYKLDGRRREELKRLLEDAPGVEINRDFQPTTYYYFTSAWLGKFTSPSGLVAGAVFLIIIGVYLFRKRRSLAFLTRRKECVLIFTLGFMGVLLELVLLLGFQIISGFVYWQMGVLFASFMLGLCLGAFFGGRARHSPRGRCFIYLAILSLTVISLSSGAGLVLPRLIDLPSVQIMLTFLALLSATGFAIGSAFVVAGFLTVENEIIVKAGSLYSADLWGAALGAILATNFIVPLLGILGALNFSALMGLVGLGLFSFLFIKGA